MSKAMYRAMEGRIDDLTMLLFDTLYQSQPLGRLEAKGLLLGLVASGRPELSKAEREKELARVMALADREAPLLSQSGDFGSALRELLQGSHRPDTIP